MPWFHNIVPEYIKKSVCTCLIKRYLGQFIENEITRDQLNLDLYNGRGTAERISLAVEALNELGETQNWPVEFVDGYIEKIFIDVPWTTILKDPTFVEITGLKITVQPKQRNEDATSMFESMWNSMTSSMHLAEEFAKEEAASEKNAQPFEGVELFAQTIESIVSRVRIKFVDTVIQVEHVPKESIKGVGLLINIDLMEFSDVSAEDPIKDGTDVTTDDAKKAYFINSFTTKKISIQGVSVSTVEFSSAARTFSRSLIETKCKENDVNKPEDGLDNVLDEETSTENGNFDEEITDRHVIMFGKIFSRQEVRIRLKQSENHAGPKVAIEVNLVNGFSSPAMEDTSNIAPKTRTTSKPMTELDYQKVEQELQNLINPVANYNISGLQSNQGWSTSAMDDSADENFIPMKDGAGAMYDSALSGVSSSMDSSFSSSMASSATEHTRRRVNNIDADPTAEISRFQIRLASLGLVLLHEDLLAVPTGNETVLVRQMQNTARVFFEKVSEFSPFSFSNGFYDLRALFDVACRLNQLRLLAAPVQFEADEKTTLSAFSITGQVVAAKLELLECLYNNGKTEHIPLVSFGEKNAEGPGTSKVSVKLKFKHVQKTRKSRSATKKNIPKTEVTIALNKCSMEFDISIMDRIATLLNHPPICVKDSQGRPIRQANEQFSNSDQIQSSLDLKINSPLVDFKVRFPIPDFRPAHDMSKVPWWERNVRPDYLSLAFSDATVQTTFQTAQACQEYVIESSGLDVMYYESENGPETHVGKCKTDDKGEPTPARLSIKIFPKKVDLENSEPYHDPMTHSCYGAFENQGRSRPGPFSAKRVVHESDTPHSKLHKDDAAELVIPGDKAELDEFVKMTTSNAQIIVDVFLPIVSAHLKSKYVYELIYNRINNDLLLWEPAAPKPNTNFDMSSYGNVGLDKQQYVVCKSGLHYESESGSDTDSETETNIYYSAYDSKLKYLQKPPAQKTDEVIGQSGFVFNLEIARGLLCLNPPVRDAATGNVIPGQQGEFALDLEGANVFVVSGYGGDDNLGYVCVQMANAKLHHCDIQPVPSVVQPLRDVGSILTGKNLHPTVYKSESGALVNAKTRGGDREMFTVAIKIRASHETHHVKTIQVSLGLNKATLRHRICKEPNSWISQLMDFFNVEDYPIPGYRAKDVLTELHLHLWDCAIDYRPLYLPLRAVVNVGNFSLSSHLTAASNSSTLGFIFEECGLFLSEKFPPKNGVSSNAPVDLKRDYVNVVELGLFEISLKTTDKKSGLNPHIDLRASNNIVHIRTCADSARALTQLLTYFADDGDLIGGDLAKDTGSNFSSPKHKPDEELVNVESLQDTPNLSKSQQEQVSELLVEAMEENERNAGEDEDSSFPATGAKLFFFPDECDVIRDTSKPLPQVTEELGDITSHFGSKGNDIEEEFCIVGDEPGLGLFPKDGVPEVKWLTKEAVRVVDNHFGVPVGKRDLLQPPKSFPTPVMRYTLCEMSIVWHMYGGNDFKVAETENKKKEVRFSETQLSDVVSFSSADPNVRIDNVMDKKRLTIPWIQRGGVDRDHDVLMEFQLNKVRFQHETYPETTTQASRQVLLISDVEIRDRLQTSQINKFLYQYTSQSRPKKSHSNMVVVKALHIRPDPKLKTQECCLKVSMLPIRLNIDQDSLLFLINFFKELGGENPSQNTSEPEPTNGSSHNTPTHQAPIMTISTDDEEVIKQQAQKVVNENLILLMEENKQNCHNDDSLNTCSPNPSDDTPIYFRKVIFSPDVFIRLDYQGKRVDMTHGSLAGLLMGLGHLNCSELKLKRIIYRHGLLGFPKLMCYLVQEWLTDIKKNQLSTILGGVGPMHALLQLFQGIRDLFWLPIEQYQKDGRIVRGLQRGANSFTTSTAMAALELTSRIIYLIQITAETAYDMLSPGPSIRQKRLQKVKGRKKRYHQPQDIREGLTNACLVVKEGISETADNIVQVASKEKEQKGYSGAVGGLLRQIPPTIIKPVIIALEATTNVFEGMQSQLVPDARREANQKWRSGDE